MDLLSPEKSREILARYAGLDLQGVPAEAGDIIRECGRLPLALAMIGALLRTKSAANLLHKLRSADLAAIQLQSYPTLFAAIQVSVNELGVDQTRYLSLSVFPEDTQIPEEALQVLWNLDKYQTQDVADRFVSLSLANRDHQRRVTLHDLQVDYIRNQAGDGRCLQIGFLERYRQGCLGGWHTGPNDGYFFEHLAYHLKAAGWEQELRQLLLSFAWIQAKISAVNVVSLLADYDMSLASTEAPRPASIELPGEPIGTPPWRCVETGEAATRPSHDPIELVQGAIRLSGHIVANDKNQLAMQLHGRLLGEGSNEIQGLLQAAREWSGGPWLRPLAPTLTPPGGPLLRTLVGHRGRVSAIAVTPDGTLLVCGSEDGTLKAWNVDTGQEMHSLQAHETQVEAMVVTPDGKQLISVSSDATPKLWNLGNWKKVCKMTGLKPRATAVRRGPGGSLWITHALALTPDGKVLILASSEGAPQFWEIGSGRKVRIRKPATIGVRPVAVMPDGERVVFGSGRQLKMYDLKSGKEILAFAGYEAPFVPRVMTVTPDAKLLISGADNGTLKIWDACSAKEMWSIKKHKGWIRALAVTPNGRRVISGAEDHSLRVCNLETGEEEFALAGHTSDINAVAVSPDSELAFSGSSDRTVKIWDLKRGRQSRSSPAHGDLVSAVAVTPDGKLAISASFDGTLKLWEVDTARELGLLGAHTGWVNRVGAVAVTPDGKLAISASDDYTLKVWNIASRQEVQSLRGHSGWVRAVAVAPGGDSVISASEGTIKLWDLATGEERFSIQGDGDLYVSQLAVTANPRLLIFPSQEGLKVRDLATGRELRSLRGHSAEVHAVAITIDGRLAISASHDKTLKVWELESGQEVRTLAGHTKCVLAVAVSLDGKQAVSASHDCTVRVWDLSRGSVIAGFTADAAMHACAVAPDGRTIVAGDDSGRVHFLRLEGA